MSPATQGPGSEQPPVPDPTILTTEQLLRQVAAERDYVDGKIAVLEERLGAIDRATRLLNETVNRVPTDVQKEVAHLRELSDEKFESIVLQFKERDTRSERESRDNKVAVDAAFAAQKEAASEQNKSNTLAINKSEEGTKETINKLAELFRTTTDGISDKVDDLKQRVTTVEQQKVGRTENAQTNRAEKQDHGANLGLAIAGSAIFVALVSVLANIITSQ